MLFEFNDDERTNKTSSAKNKMEKLNPEVLIVPSKKLQDTHVADDVDHATACGTDKHAYC